MRKYVRIEDFPALPGEAMHELIARHREAMKGLVSGGAAFKFRKSFDSGYRTDLARFHGDPEAWVSGPNSLERLKEKRRREDGWIIGKPGSAADVNVETLKESNNDRDLFAEAYNEAREIHAGE